METEVYISLQENDKHLVIQGPLVLLEKLICALSGHHREIHLAATTERTADDGDVLQQAPLDEAIKQYLAQNVLDWYNRWCEGVEQLSITPRTRSGLIHAATVVARIAKWDTENAFRYEAVFKHNDRLLEFDDWCRAVQQGLVEPTIIRQFGPKLRLDLVHAIDEYFSKK